MYLQAVEILWSLSTSSVPSKYILPLASTEGEEDTSSDSMSRAMRTYTGSGKIVVTSDDECSGDSAGETKAINDFHHYSSADIHHRTKSSPLSIEHPDSTIKDNYFWMSDLPCSVNFMLRVVLIVGTGLAAAFVPDVGLLVSLAGAGGGAALSLVIPPMLDIQITYPTLGIWLRHSLCYCRPYESLGSSIHSDGIEYPSTDKNKYQVVLRMFFNIVSVVFGTFCVIYGTYMSFTKLISL
jgi:hypothetical protein